MTQEEPSLRPATPGPAPVTEKLPLDFSAFHQMHRESYLRWAERYLHCRADAEEAVDDAFEQLALTWIHVLSTDNPAAYAWQVMKNRVVDHARARGRRPALVDAAAFETASLHKTADPIGEVEQNLRLFDAISQLSERQQDVTVLLHCEGYTTAEVAAHLGITEAGVRSTDRYAKHRLREIYDRAAETEGER
ncbi:sigma-70 family RNA polymerase sigma factor [Streptomyces sp. NPDC054796]